MGQIVNMASSIAKSGGHGLAGAFITFEGGEGSGKTTQIDLLKTSLEKRGYKVLVTREPGGSIGAEMVRAILLGGAAEALGPDAEALLFSAARQDHIAQIIRPALAAGKIVLCDRFLDSTRAYQGVDGKVSAEFLLGLEKIAVGDCMPDLTFLLDISAEAGMQRAHKRRTSAIADRFEREGLALHEARRRAFLDIAAQEPHRFEVLNADKKAQIIAAEISLAVTTKLVERQITTHVKP